MVLRVRDEYVRKIGLQRKLYGGGGALRMVTTTDARLQTELFPSLFSYLQKFRRSLDIAAAIT